MSTTLTMDQMVADVQNRIPMGLGSTYIVARLNEVFRWISQQDSMMWNIRRTPVTVAASTVDFDLPAGPPPADPGQIMALYDGTSEITFIPIERWSQQQVFNQTPPLNTFSAWTLINTGTAYKGKLAPDTSLGAPVNLNLFYHVIPVAVAAGANFFPSPDAFDSLIVDLGEAEIKRRYHLAGWQEVQQKAVEETKKLIEMYRSSKAYIAAMSDLAASAQETAAEKVS